MKGKLLLGMLKDGYSDGNLSEVINMIDWDIEYQDNNGINKIYVDGENDYILRMGWNGNITFTAFVYDDAVDCVREYTTHIGTAKAVAMAGYRR